MSRKIWQVEITNLGDGNSSLVVVNEGINATLGTILDFVSSDSFNENIEYKVKKVDIDG